MTSLLEKLGGPLQAPHVPDFISRLMKAQAAMVHQILRERFQWEKESLVLSYFKGERIGEDGLPLYAVIVEGSGTGGFSVSPGIFEMAFVAPILNRFRGRAEIGKVVSEEGAATYQWGMWLDDELLERFKSQDLPFFSETDFDCFATYAINVKEPMYRTDYELIQEKGEASAAILALESKSEYQFEVTLPSKKPGYGHNPVPEAERWDYLERLLRPWEPRSYEFIGFPEDALVEGVDLPQRATSRLQRARNTLIEEAPSLFVQRKFISAVQSPEPLIIPLTGTEVLAVLGRPHARHENGVFSYYFKIGDALVLVESWGEIARVYHFPDDEGSGILFEAFCRKLVG